MEDLKKIWNNLCSRYSNDDRLVEKLWEEIESQYSSKNRFYHTLAHLQFMVDLARKHQEVISDMEIMLSSIFYHDIIYKAIRKDNEEKSAQLAQIRLHQLGLPSYKIIKCTQQILATKHHQRTDDLDTRFFLDLDLAILGTRPEYYKTYAQQIRKEFSFYPNFIYRLGRKKVLKHFIAKTPLFQTSFFRSSHEARAKENMLAELNHL